MISQTIQSSKLIIFVAIILCILPNCTPLKFETQLPPQQRFCFYQVFQIQQKYTFISLSQQNDVNQQVQVSHIDGRQWKSVFFRSASAYERVRVDKLAASSTTYSFCVKNIGTKITKFLIQFNTGIDMLELHNLPDSTDSQNMDRQLNWLQKQIDGLSQRSQNIQGLRRINAMIGDLVGSKMIVLAIIGLVAIGGVNFVFFKVLKGELKKRKLI